MQQDVERYASSSRWLHWIHAGVFVVLLLTGLFLFVPWFSNAAIGGWSRFAHRIAAVLFIVVPVLFMLASWGKSWAFVKEAFSWGGEDMGWFKAALSYYFGGDPRKMPPQGRSNSGQKLFWLTALLAGLVLGVTGIIMWLFKGAVSPEVFQWSVFFHDLGFLALGIFFMVHFALAVLHPRMTEALRGMWSGKVSAHYAKSHHGKWYDEITKGKGAEKA